MLFCSVRISLFWFSFCRFCFVALFWSAALWSKECCFICVCLITELFLKLGDCKFFSPIPMLPFSHSKGTCFDCRQQYSCVSPNSLEDFKLIIFLLSKQRKQKREVVVGEGWEKENLPSCHLLVYSPNACNEWGWECSAGLRVGSRNLPGWVATSCPQACTAVSWKQVQRWVLASGISFLSFIRAAVNLSCLCMAEPHLVSHVAVGECVDWVYIVDSVTKAAMNAFVSA